MIWLMVIVVVLPPRAAGVFAVAMSLALLLHHHAKSSAPGRVQPSSRSRTATVGGSGQSSQVMTTSAIWPIALTLILGGIVAIGISWQPGESLALESSKMAIAGVVLLGGASLATTERQQWRFHLWLSVLIMIFESISSFFGSIDVVVSGVQFAPPGGNHGALLACILAPVALSGLSGRMQAMYLLLLAVFGLAIVSRFVIGGVLLLLAQRVGRDRILRIGILGSIALVVFGPRFTGFDFGNFSDQLRLRIWEVSTDRILDSNLLLVANGEAAFLEDLNAEPLYRTLEVSHAHNLLLHVWNSYGFIVSVVWLGALAWLLRSLWGHSTAVNAQIVAFFALAQLESIISDGRVVFAVLFVLGLRWRSMVDSDTTDSASDTSPQASQHRRSRAPTGLVPRPR